MRTVGGGKSSLLEEEHLLSLYNFSESVPADSVLLPFQGTRRRGD